MLNYQYEFFTSKNSKSFDKPNEDVVLVNGEQNVGVVLDGVSRDKENGIYPNPSPALIASRIFAEAVYNDSCKMKFDGLTNLFITISRANEKVLEYNKTLNHKFCAGTVGIVFSIQNEMLNYAYIGDCYALVLRNGMYRVFSECQTDMVAKNKRLYTSDEIRFDICNNISHPCGYGVWDGNPRAMDFVKCGSICLNSGDAVFLCTDGLAGELLSYSGEQLTNMTLDKLFGKTNERGLDDRSCIRISCN